jgi:hypothetical protein
MGPNGAFAHLASAAPALLPVEGEAVAAVDAGCDPDAIWDDTLTALQGVVGPWSNVEDELAGSLTAFGMCRLHLADRIGFELDPA